MDNWFQDYKDVWGRRDEFPSLARTHNDYPLAYFDGPGGTQVLQALIDGVSHYYTTHNSNTHGFL